MVGLGTHECRQTEDPRYAGYCACGARLPGTTRPRDRDFERQAIEHAAKGVCESERIFRFCQARASRPTSTPDGDSIRLGIDWLREAKEEAADFANYAVWWLQTNFEHRDRHQVERALSSVLLAFDCLTRVDD